jgi:hypothetical protein
MADRVGIPGRNCWSRPLDNDTRRRTRYETRGCPYRRVLASPQQRSDARQFRPRLVEGEVA